MIAVISDIHLQHTSRDGIRRREGEHVLLTEVVRNIGASALHLLEREIGDNVESTHAREIHFVLAGDIFELHRTPLWLLGGERLRPTTSDPAQAADLERKSLEILEAVISECQDFFDEVRRLVKEGIRGVPVTPHYLPGNHDRLANVFPSMRARVREVLGLRDPVGGGAARFPHALEWPLEGGRGYGVRIRHGHEYDEQNFPVPFDPQKPADTAAYDVPVLGDFASIDVATRIALAFRAFYARELRKPGNDGHIYRHLYTALAEFDDVRPASSLAQYLDAVAHSSEEGTFALMKPVLRDAFEHARSDKFFLQEAERLNFAKYFESPIGGLVDLVLRSFPADLIAAIVGALNRLQATSRTPASYAAEEKGVDEGAIDLVVAGHTHQPDHVGIRGTGQAYFLDSGTWRTRIDAGTKHAFGRLRSYTTVFCYHTDEVKDGDQPERRRFESWTGHLRGDAYGPVLSREIPARPLPKQMLVFTECNIVRIEGGDGTGGANVELTLGVDAAGVVVRFDQAHDHISLPMPANTRVSIDPSLDGEVWCVGVEKDEGIIFHHDEPLPWSVDFLPREPNGSFKRGRGQLRARHNKGWEYVIVYEVT